MSSKYIAMQEKETHITDDFFSQLPEIEPGQHWMEGLNAKLEASQNRQQPAYYAKGAALIALAILINAVVFISGLQKAKPAKNSYYQQVYQELLIVPTETTNN